MLPGESGGLRHRCLQCLQPHPRLTQEERASDPQADRGAGATSKDGREWTIEREVGWTCELLVTVREAEGCGGRQSVFVELEGRRGGS